MKTTDQMSHEEQMDLISKFDSLSERVKMFIWEDHKDFFQFFSSDGLFKFSVAVASVYFTIHKCESPVEQLLKLAMDARFMTGSVFREDIEVVAEPQVTIKLEGKTYRVDFMLRIIDNMPAHITAKTESERKSLERFIVVECDGHDFHERTKQQAQKDKSRDRVLQTHGYPVLRFTGSEIFKDPMACSEEIARFIIKTRV